MDAAAADSNQSPKTFCRQRGLACHESEGSGLPTEHLRQSARRLVLLAGVTIFTVLVALVAGFALHEAAGLPAPERLWLDRGRHAGLLLLSMAVIGVLHLGLVRPGRVADLGAGYQVAGALVMSLSTFAVDPLLQASPSHLTWLGVWIVLFPVIVPASPRRAVTAALASALTAPLVFSLSSLVRGAPLPGPSAVVLVGTFLPYLMCAGLALVPALVLRALAHDVRAARDVARDLGAYRLVARLGEGGMGEVWRAEHRTLARPAAVKLVRPKADEAELAEALRRFDREARATARLRSTRTVSLYDYGVAADGTAYYAMELLDGVDLEQLVGRHGAVSPARAIHIAAQVAESLAEAHAAGLVHRDIKPANIFLARLGVELDAVKVMDFGLVSLTARAHPPGAARATDPAFVVGTPAYMSPEQVMQGDRIDARSDIYALGCVLYWLLTGRMVFEDRSPMRLLLDHARSAPLPPSRHDPRIPADLEDLVLACLAKDPEHRPQSALELRDRLLACAAAGDWTRADAARWWGDHLPDLAAAPAPAASTPRGNETIAWPSAA